MRNSILIVEDESATRLLLSQYLKSQGRTVHSVESGEAALAYIRRKPVDIVLLDILLPGRDGLSLIEEFKRFNSQVAIILVSSRKEPIDRVLGLEMGADDYLTKPFELSELAARIKALERRDQLIRDQDKTSNKLWFGNCGLDLGARVLLHKEGHFTALSEGEFRVLHELARRTGNLAPRERLLNILRADGEPAASRSLDVLISRLRSKMNEAGSNGAIVTVHGVGYRLEYVELKNSFNNNS